MKQIAIITDDRPGIVAEISQTLAEEKINIETIDAEAEDEHGVIILTVDQYDEALKALKNAGFQAFTEDAIVVKLKDEPGALAKIALRFKEADINIKSLRIIKREKQYSLVAISTERTEDALALVKDVIVA